MKKILSLVLLACLLVGTLAVSSCGKKTFDYMEMDLGRYIYIDPKDYKSFDVEIKTAPITETDLNEKIIGVLYNNRIVPDITPPNKKNITIGVGDVANIYYRGYTLEDGVKNYFSGGSNINSTISELGIGSGSFISGFEYNLIGKNSKDYATISKLESGVLLPTDSFTLTYSVTTSAGTTKTAQTAFINLEDPNLDKTWGEGFTEYFKNKKIEIGTTFGSKTDTTNTALVVPSPNPSANGGNDDVYFDMTVNAIYRVDSSEKPVLEVEAYFPHNYGEESLQGKTAIFEVFIVTVKDYEVPELDEKFITDTLKITAEELAEFEGADLVEKYKKSLYKELEDEYNDSVSAEKQDAFWAYIMDKAKFKKLPEDDVRSIYDDTVASLEAQFQYYGSYYGYTSFDQYMNAYTGVSGDEKWQDVITEQAEESVKQKLVFYYIIREEGFLPTDAEKEALKKELYDEEFDAYLTDNSVDKTNEDKVNSAKESFDAQYTDEYWNLNVIFTYGMRKIEGFAKVK